MPRTSNIPSKIPVLQGPVAEPAGSEVDSVDSPAESGWAVAISRKLKLRKEPAKKAVIPIVGGGVRKKTAPAPVVGTRRKYAPNLEAARPRSS